MQTRKTKDVENIAYKFRIKPAEEHIVLFAKAFGCRRFIYNRMLADRSDHYKILGKDLKNEITDYKDVYPFLNEIDALVLANSKISIDTAFDRFFKGESKYPVFKKKTGKQSFTTNCSNKKNPNLTYDFKTQLLKLPKIKTPIYVDQHRKIKTGGILKSATISKEQNGNYYVSLLYEYPKVERIKTTGKEAIGLDMSVKNFYIDSNGNTTSYPRFYRRIEDVLVKEQVKLSKMKKGSNNYKKQKKKIAKLHAKAKQQRSDFLHKLSYNLVMKYDIICIEDLNIQGIQRSLNLGKSVGDLGWNMFVSFLAYKCEKYGKTLIKVNRFFPSSKTCSNCGYIHKELTLSDRTYECPCCGSIIDRDHNAAINIKEEGLRLFYSNS